MQVTITPQYVNPAKPGKKFGNVKLPDGTIYWTPATLISAFAQGRETLAEVEVQTWGTMGQVNVVTGLAAPAPQPVAQAVPPQYQQPPQQPQNGGDREEGMFIMSVVGKAMGSGQFSVTDIDVLTKAAVEAWRNRHARAQPQYRQEPMPQGPDGYGYEAQG